MSAVSSLDEYRPRPSGIYIPAATPEDPTEPIAPVQAGRPDVTGPGVPDGRTGRVRALEVEVAEREELAALQAQRAETHVESKATLRLRQASADAEDKRRLLANPARVALRDMRAQFAVNVVGFVAAVIALGWSAANVQHTAALGVLAGSAGWWLAWGVEPLISAALLTVMGAKAYLATRGVTVESRWVAAAEWVPLAYTVTLNCWTSLPHSFITHPFMEFLRGLVVHSVGPAVVVLLVHALPQLWAAFVRLHHHATPGVQNTPEQARPAGPEIDLDRAHRLLTVVRPAYEDGQLPASVSKIRAFLAAHGHKAGAPMGMWLRDALKRDEVNAR